MLKHFLQEEAPRHQPIKHLYYNIWKYGPITKVKLLELTRIKQTTMVRYLEELMNNHYIQINRYEKSSGGRPPALYEINPESNYIVGIDLSRIHTDILLIDLRFNPVDSCSFTMTSSHTPAVTIELIKQKIMELLQRHQISEENLLGIGIGTVGPLDRKNGVILNPQFFSAPNWKQVAIVKEMKKNFNQKVILENGANTAALGEYIYSGVEHDSFLYCISGKGLRCGFLANGQFMQNQTGDASAFGEILIHTDYEDNRKNKKLSDYVSLESILAEVKTRVSHEKLLLSTEDRVEEMNIETVNDLLQALQKGNPLVQEVIATSAYYYGIGLANIINITHPQKVILKSKLIDHYPAYYSQVIDTAKKHIYLYEKRNISFGIGKADYAASIGAAVLVFRSYFSN